MSDRRFAGSLHLRQASVERRDQLSQFTHNVEGHYRHQSPRLRSVYDRDTFHTSPQRVHRQQLLASGRFAFVTIDDE
jgi:hypothetical protein